MCVGSIGFLLEANYFNIKPHVAEVKQVDGKLVDHTVFLKYSTLSTVRMEPNAQFLILSNSKFTIFPRSFFCSRPQLMPVLRRLLYLTSKRS